MIELIALFSLAFFGGLLVLAFLFFLAIFAFLWAYDRALNVKCGCDCHGTGYNGERGCGGCRAKHLN